MKLSDKFHEMLGGHENDVQVRRQVADMVISAADSPERDGLLALIYHEGIGVSSDLAASLEYAGRAVSRGDGLGCFLLGYMYETGEAGAGHGEDDAVHYYERCAGLDSRWQTQAIFRLSDCCHDAFTNAGNADESIRRQLFKWTELAAGRDPKKYAARLGRLYEKGIGCVEDKEKAVDCYEDAYSHGDPSGASSLAELLEHCLADNPDMSAAERIECEHHIKALKEMSDSMYKEALRDDDFH